MNMRLGRILLFVATTTAIGAPSPQSPLDEALHLADLYNWYGARPYFAQAKRLLDAGGDERSRLYARCGAMRSGAEGAPISEMSYRLGQELAANPLLKSDKELRIFCLAAKGDFDGELDSTAMRRDWEEVRSLADQIGSAKWRYRAQGQLGFADFYDGDVSGAQRNVGAALIGATGVKDIGAEVFYLSAIANGYLMQDMNDQALQFADRAIALATANPDTGYPVVARQARLRAMVHKGQISAADSELTKVIQMPALQSSPIQMAELKVTASRIARARNDFPAAEKYLVEALKDAKTTSNSSILPTIESDLSDLYLVTGNLSKAEEMARGAATSAQLAGYTPLVPQLLSGLAQVEITGKRYREADRTYDRATAIQDMMVGNADSAIGKTALITGASGLYAKHFALLAGHLDNPAKAFLVIEQARGRVMTDLLRAGARTSPESLETESTISRLRLKLMEAHSDRQIRELRDAIFLTEQHRSITPEVNILKVKTHNSVTLSALQKELSPAEALLEYVLDDPASYCLAITRGGARIAKLRGKAAISADVDSFLKEVKAKHAAQAEARRLYADLIDAVPETQHQRRLIVVRDGPLHLVPFDALMDSTNRYLVDSRIVTYAPSASSFFLLRSTRQQKTVSQGLLAVGGVPYDRSGLKASSLVRGYSGEGLSNLPNSGDEARTAAAALPSPANTLLLGDGATEWAFKKAVNHRIIHLAVHGIANELHPERAALVLLSDSAKGEDGFLQASEIVQLALDADLVVLSACDTAVGPVEGQEGIANLSRAFLLAGARTVISTLWSVEDDTALYLMKEFYARLAHGSNAADALTSAKRTMLQTFGQTKAVPYYWAGSLSKASSRAKWLSENGYAKRTRSVENRKSSQSVGAEASLQRGKHRLCGVVARSGTAHTRAGCRG